MRKFGVVLLLAAGGLSCFAGPERYFPEIRAAVRNVKRGSEEDLALGDELMRQIRALARTRKPALSRPHLITESVIFRSGRLWYTDKVWRDRPLFANRGYWDKTLFTPPSLRRSFELMKLSGMDAVNFFMGDTVGERPYDALEPMQDKGTGFFIVPTLLPNVHRPGGEATRVRAKLPARKYLRRAFSSPRTLRFGGRPLVLCYGADKRPPADIAGFFREAESSGEAKIAYIADIDGNGAQLWPEIEFASTRRIRATSALRYFDHLYRHLETADGVEYAYYSGNQRRHLAYRYYDQVLMPIFAAACAAGPYNGKKILAWKIVQGYFNCNASQTLDSDGTKTLRGYFELCEKHKVDLLCTFEWDESNENTNIEPTVAKPMANARILKYWSDRAKGLPPAPLPGDDPDLPNLIVSTNRQLVCGQEYEVELLNVPDGSAEPYFVQLQVLDQNRRLIRQFPRLKVDPAKLQDHTVRLSTVPLAGTAVLQPRLLLETAKGRRVVEGLPPTSLRGTVSVDYSWFSTPLRNLLIPERAEVKFGRDAGRVSVDADLKFGEVLNAVEIVQNSQDLAACDPQNEFGQNDENMRLFKLSFRMMNGILLHEYEISCPGAVFFDRSAAGRPARQVPDVFKGRVREGRWCNDHLIRIPADKVSRAVLTISGTRLGGREKGVPYRWSVPLADVVGNRVVCKVFPDTLSLTVESSPKALMLPLPLEKKEVRYSARFDVTQPDAVFAVRVVSDSGKVWWSPANGPEFSGEMTGVVSCSDLEGMQRFQLPSDRVADIRYDFDDPGSGTILKTSAGRDFYANAGGPLGTAVGFEGGLAGQIAPALYSGAGTPPEFLVLPDGSRALVFDGKLTSGLFLPNTFIPPRSGFAMTFRITPSEVNRGQILFEQIGAASYLNGFRIGVSDGVLVLEYAGHTPYLLDAPLSRRLVKKTGLRLHSGKMQTVSLSWNGSRGRLAVDGRAEEFDVTGIPRWLTVSAFGGRGDQRFAGILHGISCIHSPGF